MTDLEEALRRAAAEPRSRPTVAELRAAVGRRRQRRRRSRLAATAGVVALTVAGVGAFALRPGPDRGTAVSATGDQRATPAGAHLGDGFCEPQLTNAGFGTRTPPAGAVPTHSKEAAIEAARGYVPNGSGNYDGYFASVRNPISDKLGLTDAGTSRTMWVIEASDVQPPPLSVDLQLRDGVSNGPGPYRMVVFIDDATLTPAGAWAACPVPTPPGASNSTPVTPLVQYAVISLSGIGPVRIGMNLDEARQAVGAGTASSAPPRCRSSSYVDQGAEVTVIASDGEHIDEVTVAGGDFRTDAGVSIGSTIADVTAAYGTRTCTASWHRSTTGPPMGGFCTSPTIPSTRWRSTSTATWCARSPAGCGGR